MKKLIISLALFISSCSEVNEDRISNNKVAVSLSVDSTDHHILGPEPEPILRLFDFDSDRTKHGILFLSAVTDKQLNPTSQIEVRPDEFVYPGTGGKSFRKEKNIRRFYDQVRGAINQFGHDQKIGMGNSECFRGIAKALKFLKESKAQQSFLLVFSDLQENSDLFDSYLPGSQIALAKDYTFLIDRFESAHLLPDSLNNVHVFFVFQPRDRAEDIRYLRMVEVFQELLVKRGAKVTIQAQNKFYKID